MTQPYPELSTISHLSDRVIERPIITYGYAGRALANLPSSAIGTGDDTFNLVEFYEKTVLGKIMPSFFEDFYFRIHMVPASLNLGNMASDQSQQIYVWNAFLTSKTLVNIAAQNNEGVEITADEALPIIFRPLQSEYFTLLASTEGPPSIDATFEFIWDFGSYVFSVTGNRAVTLPFPPARDSQYFEEFYWPCTVKKSGKGKEQRMSLSDEPKVSMAYKIYVFDHEMRLFESLLWGWQARLYSIPVWKSSTKLTDKVLAGALNLAVESTDYREFEVGGLANILGNADSYETVEISEITTTGLTLVRPTSKSWPVNTAVMPVRQMRLPRKVSYSGQVANEKEFTIELTSDVAELQKSYTWPWTYAGLPVLEFSPDMKGNISGEYNRNLEILGKSYGRPLVEDNSGVATPSTVWKLTFETRKQSYEFISLLQYLRGICGEFWASGWSPDLELAGVIAQSSNSFLIVPINSPAMYSDNRGRDHVVFRFRDGTYMYREVTGIEKGVVPNTEQINVTPSFPFQIQPSQVHYISWLCRSRFGNDRFKFAWETVEWSSVDVSVETLTDAL